MGVIIRLLIPLLAGLGAGSILDKVAGDKLPYYPKEGAVSPVTKDSTGNFSVIKILWFVGITVAGTILVKFIGRKLNIKILK
jgi:hypothetical protein